MMLGMYRRTAYGQVVAGLLLAGFALTLVMLHFRPPISGDALVYGDIATNLLQHKTYALTDNGVIRPTLIRLPGYPLFLSVCFLLFGRGNFLSAIWIQISLSLCECCLIALLAARLMGKRIGLCALALSALCPFTSNYAVVPLTESLSMLCVAAGFFSFERWNVQARQGKRWNVWLPVLAMAVTFATLLRPDRAILCAVLVSGIVAVLWRVPMPSRTRQMAPVVAVLAIFMLPLLVWGVRNWRVFHVVQPLSPKYANDPGDEVALGFMRWYRTWGIDYKNTVQVYWPYDGSTIAFGDIPARAFDNEAQRDRTQELIAEYNQETSSTPPVDTGFAVLARERIAARPVRYYMILPLGRLADMWLQPRTELLKMPLDWWNSRSHPAKTSFSFAYALLNAAYLVLAVIGARNWRRSGYSGQATLAWTMFSFILLRSGLLATLDNAEQRYTIDCFPLVLLLASFAFAKKKASAESGLPSC